jgi:antitoxin component of MazEF toxin-antitoxin module
MIRKIIRIGSSRGVTIPKKELEQLDLKVGDTVEVYLSKSGELSEDLKVIREAKKFMEIYGEDLKNLAQR